jgi:hypothetical protein
MEIDPTSLLNTFDEWLRDLENAEGKVAEFEAFLVKQEEILDRSEAELDIVEQTYKEIEHRIGTPSTTDVRYAAAGLEDAKVIYRLLDQESRFQRTEPKNLKDYLCIIADLKVRLDAVGAPLL